jgi:hypothetical protein
MKISLRYWIVPVGDHLTLSQFMANLREQGYLTLGSTGAKVEEPTSNLKFYYAALIIVLLAVLIPIWIVDYPGMEDHPGHLARWYILAHYHDSPFWQKQYYLDFTPLPNLAVDAIVVPLAKVLPIILCSKLLLSLLAVIYLLGCSEVGRALTGKPNWLALVAAFTFYNIDLLWGQMSCVLGMGVFLFAFAYWLRVRNAMTPLRFCACSLLGIAAYFAHLSSVTFLYAACLTVGLLDFSRDRSFPRLTVKLGWLVFPVMIMAAFMKGSGSVGSIKMGFGIMKLVNLLAPVHSYSIAADAVSIIILLICMLVVLKRCRIHSGMLAGFVLLCLSLICPHNLFTGDGVDLRFVVPGYLLLVLSIEPMLDRGRKAAIAIAIVVMMFHTGDIAAHWLTTDQDAKQVLAMGKDLPAKSSVYVFPAEINYSKLNYLLAEDASLWAISNEAHVTSVWAVPGQHILASRKLPCEDPDLARCLLNYDYVFTVESPGSFASVLHEMAEPVSTWGNATLWRVTLPKKH